MDINYSRLITIPTSDYEQITVLYLKPKFPLDTVSYFVECRNILKGIKSVTIDASGLSVSNIIFDGTFSSNGTISPTSTGTVYSFTISGGADNTSYPVNAVVQDLEGNTITQSFILYVSSNQVISSNPPLVLGPVGPQGPQGIQGPVGPQGIPGTAVEVTADTNIIGATTEITIGEIADDIVSVNKSIGKTLENKLTYIDNNNTVRVITGNSVPSELKTNGNVYITDGSVNLPSGLTSNGGVIISDGTTTYDYTYIDGGVLMSMGI